MAEANPLNDRPATPKPKVDPMHRHAQIWQHVGKMDPTSIPAQIKRIDHIVPVLGALAHKPNVNSKDVIKAAANAAAAGAIEPSEAVKFISSIPTKADDLMPWLRDLYASNLSMAVHLKAAALNQSQQSAQPQMPPQMPQGPMAARPAPAAPMGAPMPPNPLSAGGMP